MGSIIRVNNVEVVNAIDIQQTIVAFLVGSLIYLNLVIENILQREKTGNEIIPP